VTDRPTDEALAAVPERATQAGEVRARWAWAEPAAWTERMLTALENGVKGGVWFSLIDKVYAERTLRAAFTRVEANAGAAGVDGESVAQFARHLDAHVAALSQELRAGTYRPQAVRRVWIPKAGKHELRPLGIPTVRDRVVQGAMRSVLEPLFERDFAAQSYGFRPGRGCKDALRRVDALWQAGYTWVVDADLKGYFDTIPHDALMARVRTKVADGRVLALVEAYLHQHVLDGLREWTPETGTPQGAVLSPLLSNVYLDPLDQRMVQSGVQMVRYADDFVCLCRTREDAEAALAQVRAWTAEAGLTLHPEKTRIVDAAAAAPGFDFLGYHFSGGRKWPRAKSLAKLKDTVRELTRRTNGQSLEALVAALNPKLRGWWAYFQHSLRFTFTRLDQWIRQRLRSILRRRAKRHGLCRGRENAEWPNRFFAELGLYSLAAAHAHACQLSALRRRH